MGRRKKKKKRVGKAAARSKTKATPRRKKGTVRRKTARTDGNLSLADLKRMVSAREAEVGKLKQRRDRLARELAEVDAQLARHLDGGSAPRSAAPARGRRISGSMRGKLPELIRSALGRARGPMKLREIAAAVIDAGYPTKSSKFGVIVGQRIAEMKDVQKVGHGVYRLKG